MRAPERAILKSFDEPWREPIGSVERSAPRADDRRVGIGIASGADGLDNRRRGVTSVSDEEERRERHGVNHEPRRAELRRDRSVGDARRGEDDRVLDSGPKHGVLDDLACGESKARTIG